MDEKRKAPWSILKRINPTTKKALGVGGAIALAIIGGGLLVNPWLAVGAFAFLIAATMSAYIYFQNEEILRLEQRQLQIDDRKQRLDKANKVAQLVSSASTIHKHIAWNHSYDPKNDISTWRKQTGIVIGEFENGDVYCARLNHAVIQARRPYDAMPDLQRIADKHKRELVMNTLSAEMDVLNGIIKELGF